MVHEPVCKKALVSSHGSCHSIASVQGEACDATVNSRFASSVFTASSSMQTAEALDCRVPKCTDRVINPVDVISCSSQATKYLSAAQRMDQSLRTWCCVNELECKPGGCYTRSARRQQRSSASERSTFRRFRSSHPRPAKSKSSDDIVVTTKITTAVESTLLTY